MHLGRIVTAAQIFEHTRRDWGGVKVDKDKWIVTSSQLSTAVRNFFVINFLFEKKFCKNSKCLEINVVK